MTGGMKKEVAAVVRRKSRDQGHVLREKSRTTARGTKNRLSCQNPVILQGVWHKKCKEHRDVGNCREGKKGTEQFLSRFRRLA